LKYRGVEGEVATAIRELKRIRRTIRAHD